MYAQGKTGARSCIFLCSGKVVSNTYSECVFAALRIQHAMLTRRIASRIRTELRPDPARKLSANHIPLLCVQRKTPDGGYRNFPKYVGFYSKINLRN
jgi:hypothetical protein